MYKKNTLLGLLTFFVAFLYFGNTNAQCSIYGKFYADSTPVNTPLNLDFTTESFTVSDGNFNTVVPDTTYFISFQGSGSFSNWGLTSTTFTPSTDSIGVYYAFVGGCVFCPDSNRYICDTAQVAILVFCPRPDAMKDSFVAYTDLAGQFFNVLANDVTATSTSNTLSIVKQPTNGTASIVGGQVKYTPSAAVGYDTLKYAICSGCGLCDTATVVFQLLPCSVPIAKNDTASALQGTPAVFSLIANDSTASTFGTLNATIITNPKKGTVTVNNGVATYSALLNNITSGLDTFYYQVCNACGCDTAMAVVNVSLLPCAAPTANLDNFIVGTSSTCTNNLNVTYNDVNPINSGNLTITILTQPSFGTVTVVNNAVQFTYTTNQTTGTASDFKYSITNNCGSDTALATVLVGTYPCNGLNPNVNPDRATVCRNDTVCIPVTANDFDLDGQLVFLSDSNGNSVIGAPKHGRVVKSDSFNLCYIPDLNWYGVDTFVYVAGDNGTPRLYNNAQVVVTVNQCNAPPVILVNGNPEDTIYMTYYEDSFYVYCMEYLEPNGDFVKLTQTTPSIQTNTFKLPNPSQSPCDTIKAPANWVGTEGFYLKLCNEYPTCDSIWVVPTVLPREDKPVAVNDTVAVVDKTCFNVMKNDFDVDLGDSLKIAGKDTIFTANGYAVKTGDSTYCFTPNQSFVGKDSFNYVICDTSGQCDTATVYLNVGVNARDDQKETNQEVPVTIDVLNNDTQTPSDVVSLCNGTTPKHGTAAVVNNQIVYTPADNYPYDPMTNNTIGNGQDSFCYQLCSVVNGDTMCDQAMVYITIIPKGKFKIPQGFSPDGDGTNQYFHIVSVDEFPKSQLLVYNRYGDEVWRNVEEGYKNDFDGTYRKNGAPLPDGSYWYIFKFNDGVNKDKIGYIVIQR